MSEFAIHDMSMQSRAIHGTLTSSRQGSGLRKWTNERMRTTI